MDLYLVRSPEILPIWVAFVSDLKCVYSFVQNTGKFHLNAGLYRDFFFDHTMTFELIDASTAQELILSGIGVLDEGVMPRQVERYRRDPDALAPESVFGHTLKS